MSQRPQVARDCILRSPPTTAFTGLWRFVECRDWFGALVSLTSVFAIFTPILLSNVPFVLTQTWTAHLVTAWMSVAVLAFMMLVLVGSFFLKWPKIPAEPSTIAGALYYVCDSHALKEWDGEHDAKSPGGTETAALSDQRERRYRYGKIVGLSGDTRLGVDYADEFD